MEQNLHLRLQHETQRDAPLANNNRETYITPNTLRGTLTSWAIWKFIIYVSLHALSGGFLMILVPIVGRAYFDETHDANNSCDSKSYSQYAFWSSIFHCLTGVVSLLSQSYIGRLSDAYGRKKFLYFVWFCLSVSVIPLCFTDNIWWYFALMPLMGFSGMLNSLPTILLAAISDVSAPQFRTAIYGIVYGVVGIALMLSSFISLFVVHQFNVTAAFYVSFGIKLLQLLYLIFIIDESLKPINRKPLEEDLDAFDKQNQYVINQQIELNKIGVDLSNESLQYDPMDNRASSKYYLHCKRCWNSKRNPLRSLAYIKNNKVILWIGIASILTAFPETGVDQLSLIYISNILQLCDQKENSKINSFLMMSMSSCMIFSQLIILPIFSTMMNDIKLISIALTILIIAFALGVVLYFVPTTFAALLLYGFIGMSFMIMPVFSGALTRRVSAKEQGVALGVIHALKGLNACVSPFVFAYIYWFFSHEVKNIGFCISMPYMIGIVILICVYPIAWSPLRRVFAKYDEYAFKASVVPFDNNPNGHIPPQQLL